MTALVRRKKAGILLGLLPALLVAAFGLLALNACDPGDAPDGPTGPETVYDPDFDEPRPGVTARVSPRAVSLPGTAEGGDALATLVGYYRDPQGNPVEGVQMNFTADPVSPHISFNPPAAFTNRNGGASTQVRINASTPEGSYALVAYTSAASGGPNARGQTEISVSSEYETLRITTPTLGGPYESDTTASAPGPPVVGSGQSVSVAFSAVGGVPPYTWSATGLPANVTLLGNAIQGTILAPGTSAVSVTVTDSLGATATGSYSLTGY